MNSNDPDIVMEWFKKLKLHSFPVSEVSSLRMITSAALLRVDHVMQDIQSLRWIVCVLNRSQYIFDEPLSFEFQALEQGTAIIKLYFVDNTARKVWTF
jgi:hypothetical protein